jgi:hypothetical protein
MSFSKIPLLFCTVICVFLLYLPRGEAQTIAINEVMASNATTVSDQDGDFGDWIELFNFGSEPLNLEGYGLSDNYDNPFKWIFPSVTVGPGEFLLVWASGKDRRPEGGWINGIMREVYNGITGSSIGDLVNHSSYPDNPDDRQLITTFFEAPADVGNHYGQRLHGFIEAPVTGDYIFWISSDDNGRLYLSTDEDPENIKEIAGVPGWTNPREWAKYAEQQSAPVPLEAGKRYYIMALMKENEGGDNLAVRWRLPSGTIEEPIPASRLFWNETELHTNFRIDWEGEELLLTSHDSIRADEFAPVPIPNGMSFGRYPNGTGDLYYYISPTPGEPNIDNGHAELPAIPDPPLFSHTGGNYTETFNLSFEYGEGLEVYYTMNGALPVAGTSSLYTEPVPVSGTRLIRAITHEPGAASSEPASALYTQLNHNTINFSSNLPVMVIHQFNTPITSGDRTPAYISLIEKGEDGRARLSSDPDLQGRALFNIRGSSSQMFPKRMFGFHLINEDGSNRKEPLLGMPEEHNWILNGPYSDKTLMRNVIAYGLSNDIGRYSPRTRFVELYLHEGNTPLAEAHYHGVYVLTERIKWGDGRVAITRIDEDDNQEPEITGGYIIKKDRFNPGESGLRTQRGTHLAFVRPNESDITPQQKAWIENYLSRFEAALFGENSADPKVGYAKYIDPDSFIDAHLITELLKEIDGYRLSTFMHKDRGGKLVMGPLWDFNLSIGNADYFEGWRPDGWYYPLISQTEYLNGWYNGLFVDPGFKARYTERWWQLRRGHFSNDSLKARIDHNASLLKEAQQRNFIRWPVLNTYVWPNWFWGPTYASEISWMTNWLMHRTNWIDGQFGKPTTLLHFWHFNDLQTEEFTEVAADHTIGNATIIYPGTGDGYLDPVNDGTLINADLGSPAGSALRVRNPSDSRELILTLPTSGFKNIVLRYMVKRTANGARQQTVWHRTGELEAWKLSSDTIDVTETYQQVRIDFSGIEEVNDNPGFSVKIMFHGDEASGASGNNRFDNFTLEGKSLTDDNDDDKIPELTAWHNNSFLYINNPFEGFANIEVFGVTGTLYGRFQAVGIGLHNFRFNPPLGIYMLRVRNGDNVLRKKLFVTE